jgi:hypothetical protein
VISPLCKPMVVLHLCVERCVHLSEEVAEEVAGEERHGRVHATHQLLHQLPATCRSGDMKPGSVGAKKMAGKGNPVIQFTCHRLRKVTTRPPLSRNVVIHSPERGFCLFSSRVKSRSSTLRPQSASAGAA